MACFLAPTAAAIVTTGLKKKASAKLHLNWLNAMFWGGVVMLIVEHISHQEIVPYPPFLTAMQNSADIPVMLHEIATTGIAMTAAVILVWAIMVLAVNILVRAKKRKASKALSSNYSR